jgi:diguanylate cyclase (GGDEF)-like protein
MNRVLIIPQGRSGMSADSAGVPGDALTGLQGRDAFSRELTRLTSDPREGECFSLAVMDIDHFKSINDGFGHRRGDEILLEFGRRVSSVAREGDLVYRYGGDEFTAVIKGSRAGIPGGFFSRLVEEVSGTPFPGDPPLSVTLSVGVAVFPADGLSARDLFNAADRRLYAAKRGGRNRVVSEDDAVSMNEKEYLSGRMLGREKEMAAFISFSQEAADKGRGFFLVLGPDGSGKGFFLEQAASHLSLCDYAILRVEGGESHEPHGDLSCALATDPDRKSIIDALYSHTGSSMCLAVFIRDIHAMDSESLNDLIEFYSMYPGWMVVAASTERTAMLHDRGFGGVTASVRLGPVSLADCRAWFRSVLLWNPPESFIEWFHGESGGLPGLFMQGVEHLERRGFLSGAGSKRRLEDDYRGLPLGSRLAFGSSSLINNLPVDLTPFIGRDEELERIRLLMDSGARLITLRGMNGMGCRRLALRAAGQNEFMFSGGICLADCLSEEAGIAVKLASELSLPSGRNPVDTVSGFIGDSRMLLVFLNTGPGDESVTLIAEVLERCPGTVIMTTSRTPLDIQGETVVPVEGLSTDRSAPDGLSDAARLFMQTAERLAGIRFSGELKANVVEEICSLLGGGPLAIELAASWTRVMSVESICKRIRANPSFLGGTDQQRGTEGLFDLFQQSWDQLTLLERNALTRLTVFSGHFTVEEAEEISDVSPDILLSLVDRSFLLRDDMGIHIPAMTRDFILGGRTPLSRGYEVAREMHCRYFASKAETLGRMARTGVEAGRGLDGIRDCFDEITLAWKLAVEKKRFRFLRQMLLPIVIYCMDRGRFRTGVNLLEQAVANTGTSFPDGLKSVFLAYQSSLLFRTGRTAQSERLIRQADELSQGLEDADMATVLLVKGSMMLERRQLSGSEDVLLRALSIFENTRHNLECLETELELVRYHLESGNYDVVRRKLPSLLSRCRNESFRAGEWRTKLYMGNLAASEGDYRRARDSMLSYLSAVKTAGYTGKCASALSEVAGIEASQGNYGDALQHYRRAADYYRRTGSIRGQAGTMLSLAVLSRMRGNQEDVKNYYSDALALAEKARDENIVSRCLNGLAFYHLDRGESERAAGFLARAGAIAVRTDNRPVLIRVLYAWALHDVLTGNHERAALTGLALLHSPASDAESEGLCMKLIQDMRSILGSEVIESLRAPGERLTERQLLETYTGELETPDSGAYRTGEDCPSTD